MRRVFLSLTIMATLIAFPLSMATAEPVDFDPPALVDMDAVVPVIRPDYRPAAVKRRSTHDVVYISADQPFQSWRSPPAGRYEYFDVGWRLS